MQISSLNNIYSSSYKNLSFNGLWGKTSLVADYDTTLCVPKVQEECYYYPFSDESQEEINSVVAQNSYAKIEPVNGQQHYKVRDCRVCTTLPFKEIHFNAYQELTANSKITSKKHRLVHFLVKDKYLTSEYGSTQKSAVNSEVAEKFEKNIDYSI